MVIPGWPNYINYQNWKVNLATSLVNTINGTIPEEEVFNWIRWVWTERTTWESLQKSGASVSGRPFDTLDKKLEISLRALIEAEE